MNYDYMGTLKDYVDTGNFTDPSFIDSLNEALGGSPDILSNRTQLFIDALISFGLIEEEIEEAPIYTNATEVPVNYYCGIDLDDAGRKCSIVCEDPLDNSTCPEGESCYQTSCTVIETDNTTIPIEESNLTLSEDDSSANETIASSANETVASLNDTQVEMASMLVDEYSQLSNYCGTTWTTAATGCSLACPSGKDLECPPSQFCFGQITCSPKQDVTTNWCGIDWNDASRKCSTSCPAGLDSGKQLYDCYTSQL